MKKQINKVLFSIFFMFILGCDKTNEKGFYIEGKNKGLHKETKSLYDKNGYNVDGYNYRGYDKDGYNVDGYNYRGYDKDGYDKDGWNQYGVSKNEEDLDDKSIAHKFYSELIKTLEVSDSKDIFNLEKNLNVPKKIIAKDTFETTEEFKNREKLEEELIKKRKEELKEKYFNKFYLIRVDEKLKYNADKKQWVINLLFPYYNYKVDTLSESGKKILKQMEKASGYSFGDGSKSTEEGIRTLFFKNNKNSELYFPMEIEEAKKYDISNLETYIVLKPITEEIKEKHFRYKGSGDYSTILNTIGVYSFIFNTKTKKVVYDKLLMKSSGYSYILPLKKSYDAYGYNEEEKEKSKNYEKNVVKKMVSSLQMEDEEIDNKTLNLLLGEWESRDEFCAQSMSITKSKNEKNRLDFNFFVINLGNFNTGNLDGQIVYGTKKYINMNNLPENLIGKFLIVKKIEEIEEYGKIKTNYLLKKEDIAGIFKIRGEKLILKTFDGLKYGYDGYGLNVSANDAIFIKE